MNSGGIALRLIDFAKVLVGRLPEDWRWSMSYGVIRGDQWVLAAAASAIGKVL